MNQYYEQHESMSFGRPRITWAVQRLILANALIFALQLLVAPVEALLAAGIAPRGVMAGGSVDFLLGFQPDRFLVGYVYKPLTYQFLHSGLLHLFMNMLWLFFFGPDVERALGTRQFFRFFVLCGALGVLGTMAPYALNPGNSPTVIGASGAVMGVLVAYAIIEPDRQFVLFPLPVPITARALVLIVVVMNLIPGLMGDGQVSVATHFGGMITGYGYMKLAPQFNEWRRDRRKAAAGQTKKTAGKPGEDKVGEAVDNIFNFEDKKRH